jgi:hypothetical protein
MIDGGDVDCALVFINCDNGIVAYIDHPDGSSDIAPTSSPA